MSVTWKLQRSMQTCARQVGVPLTVLRALSVCFKTGHNKTKQLNLNSKSYLLQTPIGIVEQRKLAKCFYTPSFRSCDFNEDISTSTLLMILNSPALSDLGYAAIVMTYIPNLKIRDASLVTGLIREFAFLFSYSSRLITV